MTAKPAPEPELWTNRDIANYLRVSVRSIEAYESRGTIPHAHLVFPCGLSGRIKKRWLRVEVIAHLESRYCPKLRKKR